MIGVHEHVLHSVILHILSRILRALAIVVMASVLGVVAATMVTLAIASIIDWLAGFFSVGLH